jgi:hypothetical protein
LVGLLYKFTINSLVLELPKAIYLSKLLLFIEPKSSIASIPKKETFDNPET